ncbi:3-keto-5-aminohexanoate cleavage protein [Gymnodinialimonas sp. 2305UL16-5]|uniref:3-keto-5-aminohexanoate cleavage protein n=1 Tax=Gymnodinialimonas mytili TaxID=3126503 RepID=UPI0030A1B812
MTRFQTLPRVMLAPNGARRMKADHPALPITIAETVAAAKAGFDAGADALHAHIRDAEGRHSLDPGLYRELLAEMARVVPHIPVQITTESAGLFDAATQIATVRAVEPESASVAIRELWADPAMQDEARRFYAWADEAGIAIQHILYTPDDVQQLARLIADHALLEQVQCIFVLGAYTPPSPGRPDMIDAFLDAATALPLAPDWAVCAFGPCEISCLVAAAQKGGKMRIGFENNMIGPDGRPFADNTDSLRHLMDRLAQQDL